MTTASYFDGGSARMHRVELDLADDAIGLAGGEVVKSYPYAQARIAEPFAHAPCVIDFADGARCEFVDPQARAALAERLGYRKSRVVRLQDRWPAALLSLVLLAACVLSAAVWGVPYVAERVVASLPASVDKRVGDATLEALQAKMFQPSRFSDERLAELDAIFRRADPGKARMPLTLVVVAGGGTPNAFALPNGTILITDDMVLHVLDGEAEFSDDMRAALTGVFAHEIGHIEGRHSMRAIARSSLQALGAGALFGDFSAVVAGAPVLVLNMNYSREMETAADSYALALMARKAVSTGPLADLFDSLDELAPGESELPKWMNDNLSYLSSHPATGARSARFRAANIQYVY